MLPFTNQAVLEGSVLKPVEYRVTATGRPVLFLELEHLSQHPDPDPSLRMEVCMPVMVMGELADQCRSLLPGMVLRVTGRLNQKRWVKEDKVRWGRHELVAIDVVILDSQEENHPKVDCL
ncbi:MAG: single-stranded DNA-binding protein [Magnetococcales bacterium]|nr:single-stranded DNA-binding protein [Magnetococcales bacterium]